MTHNLKNSNIPTISNIIENIFQKIFLKHIKRTMKINNGVLKRLSAKIELLERTESKSITITQVFESTIINKYLNILINKYSNQLLI